MSEQGDVIAKLRKVTQALFYTDPRASLACAAGAAEIERLRAAKTAALKGADERAKEAVELRAQRDAFEKIAIVERDNFEKALHRAEHAEAKLANARKALEEHVLMPREATRAMTMAGCDSFPSCEHVFGYAGEMLRNAYRKMVEVGALSLTDELRETAGAPQPSREPVQTDATQPTGSQTSACSSAKGNSNEG